GKARGGGPYPPGEKRRRRHNPQEMGQKNLGDAVVFGETGREQSQENAVEAKSCIALGRGSTRRQTLAPNSWRKWVLKLVVDSEKTAWRVEL
ncbi:hypothetical protein GOODEAATRI_030628, partial [Goodea atripinnis]